MHIKTSFDEGTLRFIFEGELDHHAAKKAVSAIESGIGAYTPTSCVLDFERLTFMDSSGIAVVLKTYRRMGEVGGKLTVDNVGKQPLRVLDAAGIDRLVKIRSRDYI